MPDDFVLDVRQIAGFPGSAAAQTGDAILLQRGGLGGPYVAISPASLVGTALARGGPMTIAGPLTVQSIQAGALQASNAAFGLLGAQKACLVEMDASWGSIQGVRIATQNDLSALAGTLVHTFNGRRGNVNLWLEDLLCAGGAPIFSPRFEGEPRARTPASWSHGTRLATTAFVHRNSVEYITKLMNDHPFVFTFNGRTGDVTLTAQDIADAGDVFNDTQFTGTPTAPTAAPGTDTNQLATTAFVQAAIAGSTDWAPIDSPQFTGYPSAPTAAAGSSTGQIATTAFVMNAVTESTTGVVSFNARTGAVVLTTGDVTGAGGAPLASPAFTGSPTAPTPAPGTNNSLVATTAYVQAALASVEGVASFNGRTGVIVLTGADLSAAGGALLSSPIFTGTPAGPTAAPGTNTTQLATTAFVAAAIAGTVSSFNGRQGAVTLTANDLSAAGGLVNPSVALTGTPTAPTAATATSTTQLATTAFVWAALATAGGVDSFNGRAGNITLTSADITSAGGALASALANYLPLAGGTLTGPLTPHGIVGVTDGSAAVTGQVGEYVGWNSTAQSPGASGSGINVGAGLSLPPGDWDVWGGVTTSGIGGSSLYGMSAQLNITGVGLQAPAAFSGINSTAVAGQQLTAWFPAQRVSLTATTVVYVYATLWFATVASTVLVGYLYARRRR